MTLSGFHKKYLKGLVHHRKPVVHIGQKGVGDTLVASLESALMAHELIKVKFIETKDRAHKQALLNQAAAATGAEVVGMIGHVAILYRPHPDPQKRRIKLPDRAAPSPKARR